MCSASLVSASNSDSLISSEHSSLSSNNSLSNYQVPLLPDRNNNIKGLANGTANKSPAIPQPKPSPKKRIFSTPDNLSRIPKSKDSCSAVPFRMNGFSNGSKALTSAHKIKSTSTLAIPQLSSSSSKIPCLDATNKIRPNLSSRYSSHNIYLAVSQETEKDKTGKRLSLATGSMPPKQRSRVCNLNRTKQKSSLELNISNNENFYSLSKMDKTLEPVPNINKSQKVPHQQHRRHHSSSSLPRVTKSAHNSPYSKRRELDNGINGSTAGPSGTKPGSDTRHSKPIGSKMDSAKRLQGSATSLNSTASTASGSTNSTNSSNSNLHHTTPGTSITVNGHTPAPRQIPNITPPSVPFLESKKSFAGPDKASSTLVEVCSWIERNHLAST